MANPLLLERRVAPSILSADFSRLGSQVDEVLAAGAVACVTKDQDFDRLVQLVCEAASS